MPSPLRRSGSGLLQIPWPGLLSSPKNAGLDPLGPSRGVLSTRQSSLPLRPAASRLLASTPGSHPTPENLLPRSSGGLRGRDSLPPIDRPFAGHTALRTVLVTPPAQVRETIDGLRFAGWPGSSFLP